jgi:hypothetical protein
VPPKAEPKTAPNGGAKCMAGFACGSIFWKTGYRMPPAARIVTRPVTSGASDSKGQPLNKRPFGYLDVSLFFRANKLSGLSKLFQSQCLISLWL